MEYTQDFTKKFVVVLRQDLVSWQAMNALAHISAYLGNKMQERFDTGKYFITKDGKTHPRNSQYPIIVLRANAGEMASLMTKVRESDLLYIGFIREMIETTDDKELEKIVKGTLDKDIEYLGIGVFGKKEEVDRITKKFSLWE